VDGSTIVLENGKLKASGTSSATNVSFSSVTGSAYDNTSLSNALAALDVSIGALSNSLANYSTNGHLHAWESITNRWYPGSNMSVRASGGTNFLDGSASGGVSASDVTNTLNLSVSPSLTQTVAQAAGAVPTNATDVTLGGWRMVKEDGTCRLISENTGSREGAAIYDHADGVWRKVLYWAAQVREMYNTNDVKVASYADVFRVGDLPVYLTLTNHEAQIAAKSPTGHVHAAADVTNLQATVAGYGYVPTNTIIRGDGYWLMSSLGATSELYHVTVSGHTNLIGLFYTE
jgi:hypothetical protein